jgi:hypothetical protein
MFSSSGVSKVETNRNETTQSREASSLEISFDYNAKDQEKEVEKPQLPTSGSSRPEDDRPSIVGVLAQP